MNLARGWLARLEEEVGYIKGMCKCDFACPVFNTA
jgi:hypothetical protein